MSDDFLKLRQVPRPVGAPYGLLAEFDSAETLLSAARRIRQAGYTRWDAHSPFPVHGLDAAMGIGPTRLPWIVLAAAIAGLAGAAGLQWWTSAVDYPLRISGKPFFSLPAFVPVMFELTVLLGAFGAFLGMLVLNGLPRFYHPVFRCERFRRATDDRFFVTIEASDARYDPHETPGFLMSLGAVHVEVLED